MAHASARSRTANRRSLAALGGGLLCLWLAVGCGPATVLELDAEDGDALPQDDGETLRPPDLEGVADAGTEPSDWTDGDTDAGTQLPDPSDAGPVTDAGQAPGSVPTLDCATATYHGGGQRIALTDQSDGGSIRLMKTDVTDWGQATAQQWRFKPSAAPAGSWGLPSDVKLRKRNDVFQFVVSDSWGYVGLHRDDAPTFTRLWSIHLGKPANPHSVELLPNGNVVVAASTGGFVRVYAASQGANATAYGAYSLKGAHGLHYDETLDVLWALGDDALVKLSVGGTAAAPTLNALATYPLESVGGHDLSPVFGAPDFLWVTSVSQTYWFRKSDGAFFTSYGNAGKVARAHIKSVSNDASCHSRTLQTTPKAGCATTWCTDTVDILNAGGTDTKRQAPGAQIYKARFWTSTRQ